jgi:hypothetical protein
MGERVPGGNIDQSNGAWGWNQVPGLKSPNPIPKDGPTQSTVNSAPQFVAVNQPTVAPNSGTPVTTTKNPDGSTATAHGKVAGTSITVNLPG